MAADPWPAGLPQYILVDGFSEELVDDGRLSYQPDIGPPIERLRTTANPREQDVSVHLTTSQIDILRTFVRDTLLRGTLPFLFPAATEAGTYLVKFKKGGMPKIAQALGGGHFSVVMTLMILP